MANSEEAVSPTQTANVTPMDAGTAQTRQIVEAVKTTVAELKQDVKDIKEYRYTDLLLHLGVFAAAVVFVAGVIVAVYFKLDDKITSLSNSNIKIETKLEDLLARIPPVATPAPRKP